MDLKPLYELRGRLLSGAVAGAALAAEDFRLARAVEAMAPLAAASTVFARIVSLVNILLSPDCTDRAAALLDAVTLADAVLCTQGAVAAEGPAEPVQAIGSGMVVTGVPYSVLSPLLDALTSSGNGKYSFVLAAHKEHPELFKDYRVKEAMVKALGASFSELADQVEEWLSGEDESLLPLLQHGFDPKGKKDMVRRVRVIEAIAGSGADEFYLSQLEEAEKEVRQELVYALRHNEGNAGRLAGLCRTGKGGSRKAAHWALARMESSDVWEYFEELAAKKPDQAVEYMALSRAEGAGILTARLIGQWLEPFESDPSAPLTRDLANRLQGLLAALPGKSGTEICRIYRRMAALGTALDRPLDEPEQKRPDKQPAVFRCWYGMYERVQPRPFSRAVPVILKQSLIMNPDSALLSLAMELGAGRPDNDEAFAATGLSASLISEPADRAFLAAEPYLERKGIFKKKAKKEDLAVLSDGLIGIGWDEDSNVQAYGIWLEDPANGRRRHILRPLCQQMDRRWYTRLMAIGVSQDVDALLTAILCPGDRELCALVGEYFYKKALVISDNRPYLDRLCRCGWTVCENLAVRYCLGRGTVSLWELRSFIYAMPGNQQTRAQEAGRVESLIDKGQVKLTNGSLTSLKQMILDLRNSEPVSL